jgi:two-component system NtrC family response regulator
MLILRRGDTLQEEDFRMRPVQREKAADRVLNLPPEGYSLEDLEKEAVLEALRRTGGNQTRAAEFLRIPRHTLIYRMEKYGLKET